jgi:uncharacterized membrane protein
MRYGGGFRVLAALLLLGFIGLITAGAYGAGYAAGSASGTTVPAWAYGGAFGAGHVIGFLVTILVLIIVVRLILAVMFGHHHRGHDDRFGPGAGPGDWSGRGPGGWHRSEWREVGQAAFDDFHSRAHGTPPPAAGGSSTNQTAQ